MATALTRSSDSAAAVWGGRQPGRPAAARAPVRHPRAEEDDRGHLPALRVHARGQRLAEIVFGIDAEGKPLEQIAAPLTVVDG
ncbi:MAG TPA: hypothetical protein VID31_03950 [Streptosporangiaceae bacterium]|jgi:hypothetical protein